MRADKAAEYLRRARELARASRDPSTKVGAYFLHPETLEILCSGYNRFPGGVIETPDRWERPAKYLWVEHAERVAMYEAARRGISLEGSISLVSLFPCTGCARGLIEVGARMLITPRPDPLNHLKYGPEFEVAHQMLMERGVHIVYEDALADLQE